MSMDSEILTLQVDINDDPMNQKVDAIENKISALKKNAEQMSAESTSTSMLPGYNQSFSSKLSDWTKDLDSIARVRQSMEHAMSSYERGSQSSAFKRKVEVANASIKDLTNSQSMAQQLLSSLGPVMSEVFAKGLEGIVSQLSTGIRTTAQSIATGVTGKLTDDQIVDKYMRGPEYREIRQKLSQRNPQHAEVFSDRNMRQYLMATMPMNVPQYLREAVTGGSHVQFRQEPRSFREMLPASFGQIPAYKKTREVRALGSTQHGSETLSAQEIESLNRLVRNNRYAADAAVAAGVMTKSGKKMYFNHGSTHDMINAMAGFVMDDIVSAAGGERRYGITDVDAARYWKSISKKRGNNNVLDGGLQAAHAMQDIFGGWLNPGTYSGLTPFNASSGNAEYVGNITHSPRKVRRSFAEYTLDMMQNGAQISGAAPIVRTKDGWQTIDGVTVQSSAADVRKASGGAYRKKITPDDYHTISLNDSLLQQMIMSTPSASKAGHNEFSDNAFYLKYDEKLGDPRLKPEERKQFVQQYGKLFEEGYRVNGEHYINTRVGKTHAEFMKASIVDDLGRQALGLAYDTPSDSKIRQAGLAILSNGVYGSKGEGVTHFDTFKPFAKSMYNMNNLATEGESLATWKGVQFGFTPNAETARQMASASNENARRRVMEDYGTPNMKVVVGSFGSSDMDGSNWIVDTVSDEGFQGRTFGGKATYVPINMSDFRAKNYKQIQGTEETAKRIAELNKETTARLAKVNKGEANEEWRKARIAEINAEQQQKEAAIMAEYGGDLIILQAGIGGGDLVVPKDTQVIEDINNIKHYKTSLQGKTQEEMNELRSRDYSRHGIFAKTTYDDANTGSRWLSKQVINSSMNAGFRDPRVQAYFDKVLFDEISRMDNDQYVRDLLFQGDQSVDLKSEEAQQKINNHVAGMWARYSEGDRLLPTGVLKYSMAAPNPQSVINNRLKAAGIALTPEQQALELADNQVISMESLNKQLGIIRFPATKSGNVTVDNKAAISAEQLLAEGKATEAQIANLARTSGIVDRKGLYFAPNSPILKLLQGEDFDGDLNGQFGLSDNMDPKEAKAFAEVMRIVANASDKEVEEIYGAKPGTPEFEAAWKRQEERKEAQIQESKPKAGGYDLNNPYDRAAFLVNTPREHAMMGSAERSADMAALYYGGLNNQKIRGDLAQAIKDYESQYDVVSTNMKTDETWRRTREQATAADLGLSFSRMFKYANDAVETFGENDGSFKQWTGKSQVALQEKNIDALGLPSIFQGGLMGTLMGRMKARQHGIDPENGVYNWADVLNGKDGRSGLALPEGVAEDSAQGKFVRMMRGVRSDFMNSKYLLASNETVDALKTQYDAARAEIDSLGLSDEDKRKRLLAIGGRGFENFIQFGATQANMSAPWLRASVENLANQMGVKPEELVGHASFLKQPEPASVTVVPTLPKEAQTVQQPAQKPTQQSSKTAEQMLAEETPQQEAERLLKEAGVHNRGKILDANHRDALVAAISSGSIEDLRKIPGIGKKTAPKVLSALTGSKLTGIQTTSAEQMAQAVASETVPDIIKENVEQTQQITKEALEAQRQKVGNRILNSSYDPNQHLKALQGTLALATGRTEESHNKIKDVNPNIKGRSKAEYIQGLKDEIAEMQTYADMWNAYRKQQTGSTPPGSPLSNLPGGGPSNTSWMPQANPYAQQNASMDMQAAQAQYGQLWEKATEFSKSLWGETLSYQQKNEGIPASIVKADKLNGIASAYERNIRAFMATQDYDLLKDEQKENLERLISPDQGLYARAGKDFAQISTYTSSHLVDALGDANSKATGAYDAQVEALKKWDEKIKEVEADQQRLLEMSQNPKYSKELQEQFKQSADKIGQDLTQINTSRQNLGAAMQKSNQEAFDKQIENLENKLHPGNRYQQQSRQYQQQIASIRENVTKKHDAGLISQEAYDNDMKRLANLESQTSATALSMQQGFKAVGQSMSRSITNIATRFGRQLYQKALTEAKKFVVEYNRTMTEIQMITLKTDDQMSSLGDGLVAKAKELKVSIADISKSAATLYRQGLSDEEVDERLEVISKFSKVSGTKVDAATKLITVAMNTGLVTDPQLAADIVTALGDNAATNASEIEKGIEKAGAAAAADGTTFAQLASMLTAITSTTQIGGSTAGRTLNTIFGRMNKIGTNELIYDENGHAISGSAVSKLLAAQGINTYDENGKKRSSYDVLYELSQKWDSMKDAEQQQIATAIAGTRQYSNFAAIMQGMAEGKVDQYMALAGNASGIVDKKYEIYVQSLDASLTNLKNTFDELVKDLVSNGSLTGVIDTISGMIQGVDNLTKSIGPLGAALTTVIPLLAGLTMMKVGLSTGSWQLGLAGLGVAAVGAIVASSNGGSGKKASESARERYDQTVSTQVQYSNGYATDIERAKELKNLGSNRSKEENAEYVALLTKLAEVAGISFDDLTKSTSSASKEVENLSGSAKNLGEAAEGAIPHIEDYADYIINGADKDADNRKALAFIDNAQGIGENVEAKVKDDLHDYDYGSGINRLGMLFHRDSNGDYVVNSNAHSNITGGSLEINSAKGWLTSGPSNDRLARRKSFGSTFHEALIAPDYSFNVPAEYVGKSESFWESYFDTGFGTPKDLPDNVLQAVADYWNAPVRKTSHAEITKNSVTSKIAEMLNGEEYSWIPEAYRSQLPYLVYKNLPVNQYGQPDTSARTIKNTILAAAGITEETDRSQIGTEEINTNLGKYVATAGNQIPKDTSALPSVGASGYYYDPVHKEYISAKEANKRVNRATYRGHTYTSEADANAAREKDKEAAIERETGSLHQEQIVTVYGRTFGEDEGEALTKHIEENAMTRAVQMYGTPETFYYAPGSNVGLSEEWFQELLNNPDIFQYTNANGHTEFAGSEADLERFRRTDYTNMIFRQFQSAGLDTAEFWAKDVPERIAQLEDWWKSIGGMSYDVFSEDNPFVKTDSNYVPKDEDEGFRLSQAKTDAKIAIREQYTPKQWYDVGTEESYDTLEEAVKVNKDKMVRETLAELGVSDISELPTTDGTRWKWKDKWYDSYDEAVKAIETSCEELFTSAEEAVTLDNKHVDASVLVPYKNHFLEAINYDGEKGWLTENQSKVDADYISSIIQSGTYMQEGVDPLTSLMRFVNSNPTAQKAWLTVGANSEVGRILHQAHYNQETGTWEGPADIMEQLLHVTLGAGSAYNGVNLTTEEKGRLAQTAYTGLMSDKNRWFVSQEQKDMAQENAWVNYQENSLAAYNEAAAIIDANTLMSEPEKERTKAYIKSLTGYQGATKEEFLANTRNDYLNAAAMSPEQQAYLKEALGDQMYARVLEANAGGKALTASEKAYAELILGNRANGLTSLTAGQQLKGIKDIRASIKAGVFERDAAADQYMSQWSGWSEYAALLSKRKEGTLTAEDTARMKVLEQSLENFQKNAEINFEVEGVKQLEEAGKVADGTAAKIEKLKKGGKVAIDVQMQIHNEAYESGQKRARLYGGTREEQDEAAIALLGMSREEYYANGNRNVNYQKALDYDQKVSQAVDADTWMVLYRAEKTAEGRQIILDAAKKAGFVPSRDSSNQTFEYVGVEQANVSSLSGASRVYTEAEKSGMLDRILAGEERTVGNGGNSELYDAAIDYAGENTRELLRRIENGEKIPQWLQSASDAERRNAYWSRGSSMYATRNQEVAARQALAGDISEENVSTIASYLGMDDKQVKSMLEAGKGDEISDLISEKANAAFDLLKSEIESEFDIKLEAENWDDLTTELETATADADESVKQRVKYYTNMLRGAATIMTPEEAIEKYSSWGQEQKNAAAITSIQGTVTEGMTWDQAKELLIGEGKTFKTDADFNTFLSHNADIASALDMARVNGFNSEVMNQITQVSPSAVLSPDQNYQQQYQKWLDLQNGQGGVDVAGLQNLVNTDSNFREWIGQFDNLQDAMKDANGMADGTSAAFKRLHNEMFDGYQRSLRPWGDKTDEIVTGMRNAQKSAKGMSEAAGNFTSTANKAADNQYLRAQWRAGKRTKEVTEYIESLGFDKKDVKNKAMEIPIEARLKIEESKDEESVQEALQMLTGDFQDKLNGEIAANGPIEIDGQELHVGDPIIISSDTLLNQFRNYLDPQLVAAVEYAKALGFNLDWKFTLGENGAVTATPVVSASTGGGSGLGSGRKSGSRGGGGGGKSATDKTIEQGEYRLMEAQHKVKMAQIKQEHYSFTNDYQKELKAINEEVGAQKGLAEVYEDNIAMYKRQQNAVAKYSEEWWKLQKQIRAAQEALEETKNTIEQLENKRIEVVQRKQDNEDAPRQHNRNMIDAYANRFQTEYQSGGNRTESSAYVSWVKQKNEERKAIETQKAQNDEQIKEWESLLAVMEKGTQAYNEVQQKIWSIQEENAQLENDLLQLEIDLNNARLERIAKVLQNQTGETEHEINLADTRSQIYQIDRDYSGYRQEIAKQREQYTLEEAHYQEALDSARDQMATLTEGSAAWYSARDAVYEYEEALIKLGLTQAELDQALRESYLNEVVEKLEKVDTVNSQMLNAAQLEAERAKTIGNDSAYVAALEKEEALLEAQAQAERDNLQALMDLKNSGNIAEGTQEWDELLKKIVEVQNQIDKTEVDALAKANEVAAARLQNIMDGYKESIRDVQHELSILQNEQAYYKSKGELTNYGQTLNAERNLREQLLNEQRKTMSQLRAELETYAPGSDNYNKVLEELQKIEQEYYKEVNAADALTKAIQENEEAIRKIEIRLENTIDAEIKKRIQEQKNMLAGEVNLQNTILDTIKKRYQQEWQLIKKDLDKKKQALQEEKSMIQDRVNARKQAEQQEDQYSQLTELQKQLAIIEADPTRSKEAKSLRKQIEDLQKQLSGSLADNIAQAEQKRLDDMIKGITDYQANHEEDLNEYLKDNNNFKDILDQVLGGTQEDFLNYMRENNETYQNATEEQRQQMEEGWHDTWLKMRGEVETYWEQVLQFTEINDENQEEMRQKFIEYMKEGTSYLNASSTSQKSMVYEWGKMFDDFVAAQKLTPINYEGTTSAATSQDLINLQNHLDDMTFKVDLDEDIKRYLRDGLSLLLSKDDINWSNYDTSPLPQFSSGGLVDFTGPAMVHGTPSKPEGFLSVEDTATVRALIDQFAYIRNMPIMSTIPGSMFNNSSTVGDVNITINQAEINSDQDIDELAKKIGRSFTRQLSRNGFNTANYAF